MTELGRYEQELLARFNGCYQSPGGEVWVRYADAANALDLAGALGLRVLGLEGFIVGEGQVFPAMSRIVDFSGQPGSKGRSVEDTVAEAKAVLAGPWAGPPDDVHPEAVGEYMVDIVVER